MRKETEPHKIEACTDVKIQVDDMTKMDMTKMDGEEHKISRRWVDVSRGMEVAYDISLVLVANALLLSRVLGQRKLFSPANLSIHLQTQKRGGR